MGGSKTYPCQPLRVTKNYEGQVDLKKTKGRYEPKFQEREREVGGGGGGGVKPINALWVEFGWFFFLEPHVHQASGVMHFIGHNYLGCYWYFKLPGNLTGREFFWSHSPFVCYENSWGSCSLVAPGKSPAPGCYWQPCISKFPHA